VIQCITDLSITRFKMFCEHKTADLYHDATNEEDARALIPGSSLFALHLACRPKARRLVYTFFYTIIDFVCSSWALSLFARWIDLANSSFTRRTFYAVWAQAFTRSWNINICVRKVRISFTHSWDLGCQKWPTLQIVTLQIVRCNQRQQEASNLCQHALHEFSKFNTTSQYSFYNTS
jgi:hypothetical protein